MLMSQERRKIVFIDIDGTLVGDDGNVPESAQLACKKARENGHLLYLCTAARRRKSMRRYGASASMA